MTDIQQEVEAIVEEMKTPSKFSFADTIKKQSYPTGTESVYLDGHSAGRMIDISEEIDDLKLISIQFSAANIGGIVDGPEKEEADAQIVVLEAEREALVKEIQASRMTFHLRGVAPAQWRLIDAKWRKEIKAPVRSAFAKGEEGDEDFNEATLEANILRNTMVNCDQLAVAVVKIVSADGSEDMGALPIESAKQLFDVLLESEFYKLKSKVDKLSFANNLFAEVAERDADFLQQR